MPVNADVQTVDNLYRDHHGWLRGWLLKRLDCSDTAADLAQDTFLRVLAAADSTDRIAAIRKPRNYLATIAKRIMIDLFRRRSIERALLETLAIQPEALGLSTETREIIVETLVEIDSLLDAMGERRRQIFLMAQLEGLSYAEISRRMGLSVNTVRKHFIRAMTDCLMLIED